MTRIVGQDNSRVRDPSNRGYWFQLVKLYEAIGDSDALDGIWRELA